MPGLAILALAIFAAALSGMFKRVKNQKTATGSVVSLECKNESGEPSKYYAYVEFEVNSVVYTVKSRNRSTSFYTGQKFKVAYNSKDPNDAFIKPKPDSYIVVAILLIIGIIVTVKTI